MNDDDEAPPMLIDADGTDAVYGSVEAGIADVQISRVPITIITGAIGYDKCRSRPSRTLLTDDQVTWERAKPHSSTTYSRHATARKLQSS